jgi:Gliding motility associated protein GldN
MKSLRLYFLGPLSILCLQITAQVDDLMRDKNITWIAESYNDIVTDQALEGKINSATNFVIPLKYVNITEGSVSEEFTLQNIILEAVKNGQLKIYQDENCKIETSYDAICPHDSISSVNPYTYEYEVKVMAVLPFIKLSLFQAHQILFYNAKKAQFNLRTLGIAFMIKSYGIKDLYPLFWIKATDLSKKRRLLNKSITWAKRLTKGLDISADSSKILKKTTHNEPLLSFYSALFGEKIKIPIYKPNGTEMKTKFSQSEKRELFSRMQIDTIDAIDPTTYETKTKIVYSNLNNDDLKYLQVIQNWYWNDKKKRFEIWLAATAPLRKVYNGVGEIMFKVPYFYRRTDD